MHTSASLAMSHTSSTATWDVWYVPCQFGSGYTLIYAQTEIIQETSIQYIPCAPVHQVHLIPADQSTNPWVQEDGLVYMLVDSDT